MADIDRKIADKVLQLGSLNDELKQVVELTNQKNKELEELGLKQIEVKEYLEKADKELLNFKNRNLTEELRHQEQIRLLKLEMDLRQKDVDSASAFLLRLEENKRNLKAEIKTLEQDQAEFKTLQSKLKRLKEKESEFERLNINISKLEGQKFTLHNDVLGLKIEFKNLQDKITLEKKNHRKWFKETYDRGEAILSGSTDKIDNLEKTKKDLRIVAKRLKKIWEQKSSLPFPKIYHS